jgi:hypothetical protein
MTKTKLLYWASTLTLCLTYAAGAAIYLTQRPMVEEGFAFLGYPSYLITVLIVVKIAAPLAILSRISVRLSDLAYAGMFYHLLLAISAHVNAGDPGFAPALVALCLMLTSFLSQNATRTTPSPNAPLSPRRAPATDHAHQTRQPYRRDLSHGLEYPRWRHPEVLCVLHAQDQDKKSSRVSAQFETRPSPPDGTDQPRRRRGRLPSPSAGRGRGWGAGQDVQGPKHGRKDAVANC